MTTYLTDTLNRLVAIEKAALESISVQSDSVPIWLYNQVSFPYFTNRYLGFTRVIDNYPQDILQLRHTITIRLVIGHVTSNYAGGNEGLLGEWIPTITAYIANRPMLTSAAYPNEWANFQAGQSYTLTNNGIGAYSMPEGFAAQIGTEWSFVFETTEMVRR